MDFFKALGKIALGTSQMVGGVALATGHGLVGTLLSQHHSMALAAKLGGEQIKKGTKNFEKGVNELF